MVRIAVAIVAASLQAACVMLPLPGYGGVIYLPRGRVELPREMSLEACAAAVRAAANAEDPKASGSFQPMPSASLSMGNVLGVCSGPGSDRHLVRPDDIQPGLQTSAGP